MSAFANPSAAPTSDTGQEPVGLVPGGAKPRPWKTLLFVALAVAAAVSAYFLRPARRAMPAAAPTVRSVRVAAGVFRDSIRITGTTTALSFAMVAAPLLRGPDAGRSLNLIYLANAGAMVKKGDLVAQIDAQANKDHVDDVDAMVKQAEMDIKRRRAEQQIEEEAMRQNLRGAKSDLDKAILDYHTTEIRTAIDQELLKIYVDEAQAQYDELKQDYDTTLLSHKSEIKILEYTRDRHIRHRDRHATDIKRFTINASMPGLVVMQTFWRSGEMAQVQQGDQVSPNQPFMKIVDTSKMLVEASVNQVQSELIRIGQPAYVEFDAFPGLRLKARVRSVGALAAGGWRQNYYIRNVPVTLEILGHDPRLIPDLSAAVDVVLTEKPGSVLVPLEAVHSEKGRSVVFVKQNGSFRSREVELGPKNNVHAIVVSGLKSGEEIALQRPPAVKES